MNEQKYNQKIKTILDDFINKIYIIIDDLDRLNYDEIMQIFKLIRNTANFPNFIYVMAYDNKYIEELFTQNGIINSNIYLKKFYQYAYNLPNYQLNKLIEQLTENSHFSKYEDRVKLNELLYGLKINQRDIKILLNSLSSFNFNLENIDKFDYLLLAILKLQFSYFFELFCTEKFLLLKKEQIFNETFNNKGLIQNRSVNSYHIDTEEVKKYIHDKNIKYENAIITILYNMFPKQKNVSGEHEHRIYYKNNINRYINLVNKSSS